MVYLTSHIISVLSLALLAHSASYQRTANIVGSGFNNAFSYQAISDPTHGRVNYVDAGTAASQNLTFASSSSFILRADFKKTLSASGPGRSSVRLQSNKQYTTSVLVFNARHFPVGCGCVFLSLFKLEIVINEPSKALGSVGLLYSQVHQLTRNSPARDLDSRSQLAQPGIHDQLLLLGICLSFFQGEIDIMEGVNNQVCSFSSFHYCTRSLFHLGTQPGGSLP